MATGADTSLREELLQRRFNRALRDPQAEADFFICKSLEDSGKNLLLPLRERWHSILGLGWYLGRQYIVQLFLIEPDFAAHHVANTLRQQLGRIVFAKDSSYPSSYELRGCRVTDTRGDDKDLAPESSLFGCPQKLSAVILTQVEVKQHQVDSLMTQSIESFGDCSAMCNDFQARLRIEQSAEALTEKGMVIQQQNASW